MKIRVLIGAWLLAMVSGAVHALGLGEILVKSRLNQPLEAEIIVREAVPGEAEQLVAKLASQDDFARVGLERARMPVMLRFDTTKSDRGQTVIKVTSDEPIREPFLTLLVEANWSGGRLLREYGVLLDPAVTAPASTIVRTSPPPAAPAQPAAEPAKPAAPPAQRSTAAAVSKAPAQPAPVAPAATPAPQTASPPPQSTALPPGFAPPPVQRRPAAPPPVDAQPGSPQDGPYTVERGDTLFGIARGFAVEAGVTTNQMMLALHRDNPGAFFSDNINALKAGAVLRVPAAENVRSLSGADAAAEVRRHNQTWSGAAPALADAGAAPSPSRTAASAAPADARLELIPPRADDRKAAGRAGTEQGGAGVAETRAELQRTREELRSRDQEVSELASRVRDLEDLNAKNARLLELKNTEVAELQRRLAEAASSTDAAVAAAAGEDRTIAPFEDEAVDASESDTAQARVDTESEAASETDVAGDTISAMGEGASEPADARGDAKPFESLTEERDPSETVSPDEQSEAEWAASAAGRESDPFADVETPVTADNWTPAEPDAESPAQTPAMSSPASVASTASTATAVTSTEAPQPWYMRPMVQGAGLLALALILVLVLLARRQHGRALATEGAAPRRSVADLFSEAPKNTAATAPAGTMTRTLADQEAALDLQRQITSDPDDFGVYLELLSLYYAEGDRDNFETWAERFNERPGATASIEWDRVRDMGEELLPEHPLFAISADDDETSRSQDTAGEDQATAWAPAPGTIAASEPDDDAAASRTPSDKHDDETPERRVMDISGTAFTLDDGTLQVDDEDAQPIEFSLDDLDTAPVSMSEAGIPVTGEEGLDTLPPLSFDDEESAEMAESERSEVPAPSSATGDEGLDDVATKLELARAYLDMGDPEGARAMLEEVLGEGDTSQRDEARKMLATL